MNTVLDSYRNGLALELARIFLESGKESERKYALVAAKRRGVLRLVNRHIVESLFKVKPYRN